MIKSLEIAWPMVRESKPACCILLAAVLFCGAANAQNDNATQAQTQEDEPNLKRTLNSRAVSTVSTQVEPTRQTEEATKEEATKEESAEKERPSVDEEQAETPIAVREPEQSTAAAATDSKRPVERPTLPRNPYLGNPITSNPNTSEVPPLPIKPDIYSGYISKIDDNAPFEAHQLILVSRSMGEAKQAANDLSRYGAQVKNRSALSGLGLIMSVFRLPKSEDTQALIGKIQNALPDLQTDANQRYTLQSSSRKTYGASLIAWPKRLSCVVQPSLHVGVIDTQVNTAHPALLGTHVQSQDFSKGEPANATHGTAVVSILVGNVQAGYDGLLPEAKVSAAGVFRVRGDHIEATTDALLQALNWLVEQRVSVINLSLGGERNRVLELAVTQVLANNIAVVAAAGNGGPKASPVYPAAQTGVIAVTAVDAAGRLYGKANYGEYIAFAAPGVDIWAADAEQSGQYHTGTSFAAPFVSAALALTGVQQLQSSVVDKGPAGRDSQFGYGLLSLPEVCGALEE